MFELEMKHINVHINKTLHIVGDEKRWTNMSFLSLTKNATLWIWHWRKFCSLSLTGGNTLGFILSVSNYMFSKKNHLIELKMKKIMKDEIKTQMQWNETHLQWNLLTLSQCTIQTQYSLLQSTSREFRTIRIILSEICFSKQSSQS